jgi:enoyl-CoA hydratase
MEFENIIFEKVDSTAVITLNRPKNLNAISTKLLADVEAALHHVESDETIRVLVITGGEKVFAAGADVKEITTLNTPADAHVFVRNLHKCFKRLEDMEIPVIAAISGFAFGGGCELALACDFRIASETAQFALPEINLGLMPGAGGTQRLPRLIGMGRAFEMLFTGAPVTAQRASETGLTNKVVPEQELMAEAMKTAKMLGTKPGFAMKMIKKAVQTGMNTDLTSALDYEARCFEMLFSTHDQKEGTTAFVEKRKPDFKGY